ncbi:hypothetical protein NE237_027106 [Protea cynaroides]|uniref:HTH OST-type domain-containing protein n=1 Tax=Protea cynaroides TaxID=273540 RepID=A0A9Q0GR79_9MAGN|nr:hypothetical protein NE237_027106 [Protea cynaroides]
MRTLASRTVFRCTASSSTTTSPNFLSCHCLFFYSSSAGVSQKRRAATAQHSSSSSFTSNTSWRHHDEESRKVKVSIWWDFENCSVPAGTNVFRVTQRITSALRANGIKGPVTITAFGDVMQLSRSNSEALSSTGVCLNHIPHGGKNSADRTLMIDLVFWASQNPPPVHLFLISGDRDFSNVLHQLRMNNYNILLASTDSAPGVLCSAASIVWQWNALVRGESLAGKHFNQPPDGPYGSWYGYYKGPLEDPFSDMEQPACSLPEESPEAGTDSTIRPVPKAFVNRIQLEKSNMMMDKDYFGHKRFSRLILSMCTVLKLQPAGDGQMLVHGIHPDSAEPVESNSKIAMESETNNGDGDQAEIVKQNGGDSATKTPDVDGKSWPLLSPAPQLKIEEPPPVEPRTISYPTSVEKKDLTSEQGIFRRIYRTWFDLKKCGYNEKGDSIPEKCSTSDGSKKAKSEEKYLESVTCPTSASSCSPSSSNATLSDQDNVTKDSGESGEKSSPNAGLFHKIINWCRFWRTSGNPDNNENVQCCKELKKRDELFSHDFFWTEIDLYIHTPRGSVLLAQSKTREQMAQKLQKEGPVVLNDLSENDLLHVVDLLISEKKWVEEDPSKTFPFKLICHSRRGSSHPPGSNGLSSFSGKLSQSQSQGLPEHGMEKRDQNQFQPAAYITDCQKLVTELLEEYPEGFNMGSFRKLFEERYGYILDYQMLGYSKLAALFQVMPKVKIESCHIRPAKKVSSYPGPGTTTFPYSMGSDITGKSSNLDGELSNSARTDNDHESTSNRNDTGSRLNGELKKEMKEQLDFSDEYLSDDELSDWECENENRGIEELVDCSRIDSKPSSSSQVEMKNKAPVAKSGHKTKHVKKHSVVSEPVGDGKEKSIDNILRSLKKSAKTRTQG